jgi:hypothetical protein
MREKLSDAPHAAEYVFYAKILTAGTTSPAKPGLKAMKSLKKSISRSKCLSSR